MADKISSEKRSENMRRIRSKDTTPELVVRRVLHRLGLRYRLHVKALPGKPDLVFTKRRKIIEVRGCFWHQHGRCEDSHIPNSRLEYWLPKLQGNVAKDKKNLGLLKADGWDVMVVWECQTESNMKRLTRRLVGFLNRI